MPDLPARPDLDQLHHEAKDVLHAAQRGNPAAVARINAVPDRLILSSAQLALAREYGFASWAKLKLEVERATSSTAATCPGWHGCWPSTPNWPPGRWNTGPTGSTASRSATSR
jgi:hypothetical protein